MKMEWRANGVYYVKLALVLGARLVQKRYRLHFLSDRAGFIGEWTDHQKLN